MIDFPLQANEKNIRISALDDGEVGWGLILKPYSQNPNPNPNSSQFKVKIFLIACSIKEAEKLHTALEYRFVFISVFSPFHSLQSLTCAIEFRINQLKTDKENGVGEAEDDESVKVSLILPPMNPQDDGMPSSETKFFPGKRGGGC